MAPFHPQTKRKLERYHQTLKRGINQVPYDVQRDLEAAIGYFVSYDNLCRYHKALSDVTLADVLASRSDQILGRSREANDRTVARRKRLNIALRERLAPA